MLQDPDSIEELSGVGQLGYVLPYITTSFVDLLPVYLGECGPPL
jgi:hypothetical protein